MKNKIIYLFIFLLGAIFAQSKPLFPGTEARIYKITKMPSFPSIEFLLYVGSGKNEVIQTLGTPLDISRDDANEGEDVGYDGLFLNYQDGHFEYYNNLILEPRSAESNSFIISKKFYLGLGRTIPKEMFDYQYKIYKKGTGIEITPSEEAMLPKEIIRGYYWNIIAPTGFVSDDFLAIDVKDQKIIKIYIGSGS